MHRPRGRYRTARRIPVARFTGVRSDGHHCVFDYWGVRATDDIGNMVFNLVHVGIFGKTDEDTPELSRGL